jgi:tetratricopeptide (TPR) repeat protein
MALASLGRLGEAIEQFRQALAANPDHAAARESLREAEARRPAGS